MKWEKFEKDDFSIQPYQTASFARGLFPKIDGLTDLTFYETIIS